MFRKKLLTLGVVSTLLTACFNKPADPSDEPTPARNSQSTPYVYLQPDYMVIASGPYDAMGDVFKVYSYAPDSNVVDYQLKLSVWVPAGLTMDGGIVYNPVQAVTNNIDMTARISVHPDHQVDHWELMVFNLSNSLCVTDLNSDGKVDHRTELDPNSELVVVIRDITGAQQGTTLKFPLNKAKSKDIDL